MRVVVIGSGIVGASVADHLAAPAASGQTPDEIVVVDRAHPGKATLAGAGIVCPWASAMDDGPMYDLYAAGAAYYEELLVRLADRTELDVGYRRVGALVVSQDPRDLDAAEERLARRLVDHPEAGVVRRLDPEEARARFPPLTDGLEAIHIAGGARVDGRLLAEALLAASGVSRIVTPAMAEVVMEGDRVAGVRIDGPDDVDGVDGEPGQVIPADVVVVAAGAWTNEVLAPLGAALGVDVDVDVEPQKGQIIHFGVDDDTSWWPVVLPVGPHYLLAFDDSRVVVGATRETDSGFDVRVTAAGQAEVLATTLSIAPGLAEATVLETRVGLRPFARGLPTIGPVPGIGGLFVGTGLGAAGLTIGPLWGRLLADLVLGNPTEVELDLTPFLLEP